MRRMIAACTGILVTGSAFAAADAASVRIGGATIRYDAARFSASSLSPDRAWFIPIGSERNQRDGVKTMSSATAESCAALAEHAFAVGPYDVREMETSAIIVGGVASMRFTAHTRCRNATPRGEVACVKTDGHTYVLTSLQSGCGGNPFPHSDTLGEIAAGMTFSSK